MSTVLRIVNRSRRQRSRLNYDNLRQNGTFAYKMNGQEVNTYTIWIGWVCERGWKARQDQASLRRCNALLLRQMRKNVVDPEKITILCRTVDRLYQSVHFVHDWHSICICDESQKRVWIPGIQAHIHGTLVGDLDQVRLVKVNYIIKPGKTAEFASLCRALTSFFVPVYIPKQASNRSSATTFRLEFRVL